MKFTLGPLGLALRFHWPASRMNPGPPSFEHDYPLGAAWGYGPGWAEWRMRFVEAEATALVRLRASLTAAQLKTLDEESYFEVVSNHGNRWRIYTDRTVGNAFLVSGLTPRAYCTAIRSIQDYPASDLHLAQALTLATDEDSFLSVASRL